MKKGREGDQISTPDIFDQISWNESIWDRLYNIYGVCHDELFDIGVGPK